MAQIDSNATLEEIAQVELKYASWRRFVEEQRAAELARLSDVREAVDGQGSTWTYVVVDGVFARILACSTRVERLAVPEQLDGFPVKELGPEALAGLDSPREITCSGQIESIGAYAFRECENLRKLALPARTHDFQGGWIAKCPVLEELVLPDELEALSHEVVSNPALRTLAIGSRACRVEPGAFDKSQLEHVSVDDRNPHLVTDGTCLYSADGSVLVALDAVRGRVVVASGELLRERVVFRIQ